MTILASAFGSELFVFVAFPFVFGGLLLFSLAVAIALAVRVSARRIASLTKGLVVTYLFLLMSAATLWFYAPSGREGAEIAWPLFGISLIPVALACSCWGIAVRRVGADAVSPAQSPLLRVILQYAGVALWLGAAASVWWFFLA